MKYSKEAIRSLLKIKDKVEEALADGKMTWKEDLGIAWESSSILAIIKNLPEIGTELKTATSVDIQDMIEEFKTDFEISNNNLEKKVEAAIQGLANFYYLFIPE